MAQQLSQRGLGRRAPVHVWTDGVRFNFDPLGGMGLAVPLAPAALSVSTYE